MRNAIKKFPLFIFALILCHLSTSNSRTLRGFSITYPWFILTYSLLVGKWPPMMMRCSHKLELLLFALISIELWNFKDLLHEKPSSRFFSAIFAMAWWVLFFVFLIIIPTKMHTGFKFRVLIWRRRGRPSKRYVTVIIRLIFGKIQYKSQHECTLQLY